MNATATATIAAVLTGISLLAATACTATQPAALDQAARIAASCPTDGSHIAAIIQSDQSASRENSTAQPDTQQIIHDAAERTAICNGHFRVNIFAGSAIATTVFDGDLRLDGATENARLRKAPTAADDVMVHVNAALPDASMQLPDGATDIVGQYQPAAEYEAQLAATGSYHLEETILTDGIQTVGQNLNDPGLTPDEAQTLAGLVTVPNLAGATVRIIGVGRQADDAPLPTPYIAALRMFHTTVCERTRAACTVVTDAAGA
ncbi:hypothetical protein [Mycolicibacterium sphagni]|uniref:Uncharacterized protein n=1 Tax=Mycolicibacterium sphagni TaxID=1786 RepID=A0A255DPU1_9MYCO|nr:hypothetical protein [Mycolicibacterium sphagni]OYN77673.1 hypothetical protein CG716_17415 [Mycolicibacterium sphagni]